MIPMRKVKLFAATSLDGLVARPDGAVDWLFSDGDYGFKDFTASVDTVLIGRKTLDHVVGQGLAKAGVPLFPGMKNYIFSRATPPGERGGMEFVGDDVAGLIGKLQLEEGKDLWLVGGGDLTRTFLELDLVDEVILSIHPILLGDGIPMFPGPFRQTDLQLANTKSFPNGLLQVSYARPR
jgi:dihydrofolate reductase